MNLSENQNPEGPRIQFLVVDEQQQQQETHVMRLDISVGIVIGLLYKHTEYDVISIFFSSPY